MPTVTSIQLPDSSWAAHKQASRWGGEMRVVTLSDGRRLRVNVEQIARHALTPGEAIGDAVVARLKAQDLYLRAREAAVRLLAVRPRSTAELRVRLRQKKVPGSQIRAVLHDLTAAGYLDDLAFARAWIASRMASRPSGMRRLRWELREKGVPTALVDQAIQELVGDEGMTRAEERAARALVERRLSAYRGLTRDQRTRRIAGLLQRRGFAPTTVVRVLRTLGHPDFAETADA